jgi:predicted permease
LLRFVFDADTADIVLGDLEELRRERARRSPARTAIWFGITVVRIVAYASISRLSDSAARISAMPWLDHLARDIRHGFRTLRRRPAATMGLVAVLVMGIGPASAMFAMADPFVLRTLPYGDPDQLVVITLPTDLGDTLTQTTPIPTFDSWRQRRDLFVDLAAFSHFTRQTWMSAGAAEELATMRVTPNFFDVLRHQQGLTQGWNQSPAHQPMVALTAAGQRKASVHAQGHLSDATGTPHVVTSLLSSDFQFPHKLAPTLDGVVASIPGPVVDVTRWQSSGRPASYEPLMLIGRLAPKVTPTQAAAALSWTTPAGEVVAVQVEPLHRALTTTLRPLAQGGMAAGLLILAVCVGNITNLLLARRAQRAAEMATLVALGATRLTLARTAAIEALMLTVIGTIAGLFVAWWILGVVAAVMPDEFLALGAPSITGRVWAFALGTSVVVIMLAAIPGRLIRDTAWSGERRILVATRGGRRGAVVRFMTTALQCGLAVLLLIGAALLVRSYVNIVTQDGGLDPATVILTARLPAETNPATSREHIQAAVRAIQNVPGIDGVAVTTGVALDSAMSGTIVNVDGRGGVVGRKVVSEAFFTVAGLRLIEGRPLAQEDRNDQGVVVNAAFARKYWPEGGSVGRALGFGRRRVPVVGVVEDAFDVAWDQTPEPAVYLLLDDETSSRLTFVLNSRAEVSALREPVRRALASVDPRIVIREMGTAADRLALTVRDRTLATLVLSVFALAGIGVSVAGIVGIVSSSVTGRTREIAIRLAIGSSRSHARWLVVRETLWAAVAGSAAAMVFGRWLSRTLESLVYGLDAGSLTHVLVSGTIAALAMSLVALIPARRAMTVQPTEALRAE